MAGEELTQNAVLDSIPSFTGGEAAPAPDTQQAVPADAGDGASQHSEAEDTPKTALEAAERVMERAKEASLASATPQTGTAQETAKPSPDELKAGDAKLPFANHPRWKEATSEIRILKVAKEKNEGAIKELEPKAQTFDQLSGWLRENSLGKDDLTSLLTIGAAVRNDPQAAYDMLRPIMEELELKVGVRLPQDLENAVAQGQMTQEAAQAIARSRGEATLYKGKYETSQQRQNQEREERAANEAKQQAESLVQGIVSHVDSWATRDPDAARKRPFVEEAIELELRKRDAEGTAPQNVEQAIQIVDGIVKAVNDRFRSFMPRPKPVGGILPNGANLTPSAPVPKSSLEAAQLALRQGG